MTKKRQQGRYVHYRFWWRHLGGQTERGESIKFPFPKRCDMSSRISWEFPCLRRNITTLNGTLTKRGHRKKTGTGTECLTRHLDINQVASSMELWFLSTISGRQWMATYTVLIIDSAIISRIQCRLLFLSFSIQRTSIPGLAGGYVTPERRSSSKFIKWSSFLFHSVIHHRNK